MQNPSNEMTRPASQTHPDLLTQISHPHPAELLLGHSQVSPIDPKAPNEGLIAFIPSINEAAISLPNRVFWVKALSIQHAALYLKSVSNISRILQRGTH